MILDEILKTPIAVLLVLILAIAGVFCIVVAIIGKIPRLQVTGKGAISSVDIKARKAFALGLFGALLLILSVGLAVAAPVAQQTKAEQLFVPTINALETKVAEPSSTPSRVESIVSQMVVVTPTLVPTATPSQDLIDSMEIPSNWIPSFCDEGCSESRGASVIFHDLVSGKNGKAIEIIYDVKDLGWVLITKRVDYQVLSGTSGIGFAYKGNGAPNTIELKLLLRYPGDSRDTAFGASWNGKTDTDDTWIDLEALYNKDFTCWFPEDLCKQHSNVLELTAVKRIDIAISNKPGDTAGPGKVAFDDLVGIAP